MKKADRRTETKVISARINLARARVFRELIGSMVGGIRGIVRILDSLSMKG